MFIYIDLTTKDSKTLNIGAAYICPLNSAKSYCSFKYGKNQLRVNASDIALNDVNVTTIKKQA
jgi:hypothetical protein